MKSSKQCPKCNSLKIALLPKLDRIEEDETPHEEKVGYQLETTRIGSFVLTGAPEYFGKLLSYICTACGYTEVYVAEPGTVPWASLRGLVWLNGNPRSSESPYR